MKALTLNPKLINSIILPRKKDTHKGSYGHVFILAGSRGMTGAVVLCAGGALRSGAGLVTVGVPSSLQKLVAGRVRPEAMTIGLPEEKSGSLSYRALGVITDFIIKKKITSVVIGPGLGSSNSLSKLVQHLLEKINLPIVLDADGINALSKSEKKKEFKMSASGEIVITPHPGEFSRLTGVSVKEIQRDRSGTALSFSKRNKIACVLKGFKSVITNGNKLYVNPTGNPGMATGGAGDVLSGMIAALVMQVKEPRLFNASLVGVYIHGLAGDIAAGDKTEIALLAGDISESIPKAFKKIV